MTNQELYSDYKWIKVKRYTMDESKSWEERYKDLDEHHLKETTFLINEVRFLAKKLDDVSASETKLNKSAMWQGRICSLFVIWWVFSIFLCIIYDWAVDKQTQRTLEPWAFICIMLIGAGCSTIFTYYKWRHENGQGKSD